MRFLKLLIIFLIIVAIPVFFVIQDKASQRKEYSIATGGKSGGYYANALKYKKILAKDGVDLKIVTTAGSIDAQNRLINKEVDFAFVQGGTEIKDKGLQSLANIAYEPIWVFVSDKNITSLDKLLGKKVAVGKIGSGIYPVAKVMLNELGIDKNNTKFLHLSNSEASSKLKAKEIDAMFYVASPNSKVVKSLLGDKNISLINFKNAGSFRQYFIKRGEDFQILQLYSNGINLKDKIPAEDYILLAKNTSIATRGDISDEIVRLLMKAIDKIHSQAGLFHKEGTFPNSSMLAFPQHVGAKNYFKQKSHFYEEHFDYWTAQSLNKLHDFILIYFLPVLAIFGFFIEVVIPTMDLITRRKVIKWYDKINEIDTGIENFTLQEALEKKAIVEDMLHTVRSQDDIPAHHMEEFYTLQNQIANILDEIEKRIAELRH